MTATSCPEQRGLLRRPSSLIGILSFISSCLPEAGYPGSDASCTTAQPGFPPQGQDQDQDQGKAPMDWEPYPAPSPARAVPPRDQGRNPGQGPMDWEATPTSSPTCQPMPELSALAGALASPFLLCPVPPEATAAHANSPQMTEQTACHLSHQPADTTTAPLQAHVAAPSLADSLCRPQDPATPPAVSSFPAPWLPSVAGQTPLQPLGPSHSSTAPPDGQAPTTAGSSCALPSLTASSGSTKPSRASRARPSAPLGPTRAGASKKVTKKALASVTVSSRDGPTEGLHPTHLMGRPPPRRRRRPSPAPASTPPAAPPANALTAPTHGSGSAASDLSSSGDLCQATQAANFGTGWALASASLPSSTASTPRVGRPGPAAPADEGSEASDGSHLQAVLPGGLFSSSGDDSAQTSGPASPGSQPDLSTGASPIEGLISKTRADARDGLRPNTAEGCHDSLPGSPATALDFGGLRSNSGPAEALHPAHKMGTPPGARRNTKRTRRASEAEAEAEEELASQELQHALQAQDDPEPLEEGPAPAPSEERVASIIRSASRRARSRATGRRPADNPGDNPDSGATTSGGPSKRSRRREASPGPQDSS